MAYQKPSLNMDKLSGNSAQLRVKSDYNSDKSYKNNGQDSSFSFSKY